MWPRPLFLGLLLLVSTLALLTKDRLTRAGNAASRLAAAESIVERGTFSIDNATFSTVDRVRIGGRFYSDKPALPIVFIAGVYGLLHHGFGLSFHETPARAIYWVTLVSTGIFTLLLYLLLFRYFYRHPATDHALESPHCARRAAFLGLVTIFSTWIISYSVSTNNHTPAAALLFLLYLLLERGSAALVRPRQNFGIGLVAGMLLAYEIPFGLVFGGLSAIAMVLKGSSWPVRGRAFAAFSAGLLPLIVLSVLVNIVAFGSWLPAYLVPGAYDFPQNIHSTDLAGLHRADHALEAIWMVSIGGRGLFSHMPAAFFILIPLVLFVRRKLCGASSGAEPSEMSIGAGRPAVQPAKGLFAFGSVTVFLFYALLTGDFGGWAYGFRYLIPLTPLLFVWSVEGLQAGASQLKNSATTGHSAQCAPRWVAKALRTLFFVAVLWGLFTSFVGLYDPWPVAYEGAASNPVSVEHQMRWPLVCNLLTLGFEKAPNSAAFLWLLRHSYGEERGYFYLAKAFTVREQPAVARRAAQEVLRIRAARAKSVTNP